MSIYSGPSELSGSNPARDSTAVAVGVLSRAGLIGGGVIMASTGTFSLWRDDAQIVAAAPMLQGDAVYGPGSLMYVIAASLMTRGIYVWTMVLLDPATSQQSALRGRFTVT